jgi:hypothetical protein
MADGQGSRRSTFFSEIKLAFISQPCKARMAEAGWWWSASFPRTLPLSLQRLGAGRIAHLNCIALTSQKPVF